MNKLAFALNFVLAAFLSLTPVVAQERHTMVMHNCPPSASLDGTRVYQVVSISSNCSDNHQISIRFVDYSVGILCYVEHKKCVLQSDMNARERQLYTELRPYAISGNIPYKYCIQQDADATWKREMLTGRGIHCTPSYHTIRETDSIRGSVCVYHFGKLVDCVRQPSAN